MARIVELQDDDDVPLQTVLNQRKTSAASAPMKHANKPFLVHQKHLEKRRNQREASNDSSTLCLDVLFFIVFGLIASLVLSKMTTGTFFYGQDIERPAWTRMETYFPKAQPRMNLTLTDRQLKIYDGSNPALPIYLALNGTVYDVSANRRTYGPGGSYHHFAGVDAARAYITGCFKTHLTHDLRGIDDKSLQKINGWRTFYETHKDYFRVGRVIHEPIDPSSPIPEDCRQPASKKGG